MSFGFRRRLGFGPFHVNLSKHGLGASVGVPGFTVGKNARGSDYLRAGIPGTGLFYRGALRHHHQQEPSRVGFFAVLAALTFAACFIWLMNIS
jgi:uncharacterized protein DUF4236